MNLFLDWIQTRTNIDFDQIKTSLNQVKDQIVTKIEVTTNEFFKEPEKVKYPWQEPPDHWKGKEEELKNRILDLSLKATTFLSNTPSDFKFSFEDYLERAQNLIDYDKNLAKYVYSMIPKETSELDFWKNYFYRIKIILETEDHSEIDSILQSISTPIKKKKVTRKVEYDYSPLEHDLKIYKENLTSVLQECMNEYKKKKKFQENETLNQLYKRIIENKKDLALWLVEIQDPEVLSRSAQVNEHISLVLKEFEEYKQIDVHKEDEHKIEEKEKIIQQVKNEILQEEMTKNEEKQIQVENQEKELEKIVIKEEILTETKLPWEEEEEDFVYSK